MLPTSQYDEFITGIQPARLCVLSLLLQGCKSCAGPLTGFATKTSPQGAPLPTDHSIYNIYDSA